MLKFVLVVFALALLGPVLAVANGKVNISNDWRTADRSSQGIAPSPQDEPRAVIHVYAARAFSWRGIFAVHTWVAVKPSGSQHYVVHQVVGWREWQDLPVVVSEVDEPDRSWYGNAPELLLDIRGEAAERLIPKISKAISSYPYRDNYTLWPGPNSNTFVAHIAREVPELKLALPTTAIGKDYLSGGAILDSAPSGTGCQISLFGLAGITVAREEGIEVNLLTANFGFDFWPLGVMLPGVGRIGF